jgi:hypothetical protein
MPLGDPHALVAQENRDPFDRHAGKQELHRERSRGTDARSQNGDSKLRICIFYKQLTTFLRFSNDLD